MPVPFISTLLSALTSLPLIPLAFVSLSLYTAHGALHRLYLSPMAKFPGPRFAALTFWNEFFYDVVCAGRYTWKIAEYHGRYGPIVRINPYEIHINDPDFYDELYVGASKGKSDKWFWSMRMFGQYDHSSFDTLDHDIHRIRREPWNPFFSKAAVARLQPLLIQNCVDKLCDRLAEHRAAGKMVVMVHAYACLAADVISGYSFPEGYGLLDGSEFRSEQYEAWVATSKMSHVLKQFGWLFPVLDAMPLWLLKWISPESYLVVREHEALLKQCIEVAERRKAVGDGKEKEGKEETAGRPSMIEAFMDSNLPEADKTPERIRGEMVDAMQAGTITSTHALKTATYHILANPPVFSRLMMMLETEIPDPNHPPNLRELEQMDYLLAIFYETLRLFHGVSQRLQRIFPDRCLQYKEWTIPPGTPVSMTSVHVHDNPTIFPEPYEFKPDRWLPLHTNGVRLQKYLVAFGRGSRSCVGMELGKAEILTTLANVFRRFGREMRLVDCVRERDVDIVRDAFNPLASEGCNGLIVAFDKKF